MSYAGKFVDSYEPGTFLDPGPYGCLGMGPGYALAAGIAHPDRQVVLLLGDGAIGFALGDFEALVRHGVNVTAIVGNNGIWGLEKHPMQALFGYDVVAELAPGIRYDKVVEALGGHGELVDEPPAIWAPPSTAPSRPPACRWSTSSPTPPTPTPAPPTSPEPAKQFGWKRGAWCRKSTKQFGWKGAPGAEIQRKQFGWKGARGAENQPNSSVELGVRGRGWGSRRRSRRGGGPWPCAHEHVAGRGEIRATAASVAAASASGATTSPTRCTPSACRRVELAAAEGQLPRDRAADEVVQRAVDDVAERPLGVREAGGRATRCAGRRAPRGRSRPRARGR